MRISVLIFVLLLLSVRVFSLFDSFEMLQYWAITLAVTIIGSIAVVWWRKSGLWALSLLLLQLLSLHFYLDNPDWIGYSVDYIGPTRTDHSNYPTIQSGDFIISKHFHIELQQGAMYGVFADQKMYRKRLHGMPQDKIHVCHLRVYVNGKHYSIDQQWVGKGITDFSQCKNTNHVFQLKDGEYYVLGDYIYNSKDSRTFGPVQKSQIMAKSLYVIDANGVVTALDARFN